MNKLNIMKTETRNRLMIWAIVFLAVMNITTLGTILYHEYISKQVSAKSSIMPEQLESNSEKFSGGYFRDELKFSDNQMDLFRGFNPHFRRDAREITINLANLRKRMLMEMSSEVPDSIKVINIADSIGILHKNLKLITFKYYTDIKNICDNNQKIRLDELFSQFFVNDVPVGFNGRGYSGRRGNGNGSHRQTN